MAGAVRTTRTARHVIALRRVARAHDNVSAELGPIIADLRDDLASALSKRAAADIIGVSVPTLDAWIERGLLPVEQSPNGRSRVRRDAVLDLAGRVEDLRQDGRTRHLISAAVDEMLRADEQYQREFAELYGPGLAALANDDLVSAEPGPEFADDD